MISKRVFGFLLTIFGFGNFIYASQKFLNAEGTILDSKTLLIYCVLGALIFAWGISLIKATFNNP